MAIAINLAKTTNNQTLPNPNVAAILVKDNKIIATGIHLAPGEDHAEIIAIKKAGSSTSGSTLYVTLEPCSHFGKTPPCVDAIIQAKITTVVCAMSDPNPLVNNQGINKLKAHGIIVITNILENDAQNLNKVFIHNIKTKLPYITVKAGLSLDGKIACHNGTSKWITNNTSRQDSHQERTQYNGILVGVNTVLSDNPSLTPYLVNNAKNKPIRIILDTTLKTPTSAKVIQDTSTPTYLVSKYNSDKYKEFDHIKVLSVPSMDMTDILRVLFNHNIYSIFVEGGSSIYTSLFSQDLVNQLILYYSPQLIGGTNSKSLFDGIGYDNLQNNPKYTLIEHKVINSDIKLILERN